MRHIAPGKSNMRDLTLSVLKFSFVTSIGLWSLAVLQVLVSFVAMYIGIVSMVMSGAVVTFGIVVIAYGIVAIISSIGVIRRSKVAAAIQCFVSALPVAAIALAPSTSTYGLVPKVAFFSLLVLSGLAIWLMRLSDLRP